ncbi:MAG: tetratricopeptide repeat protein [Candidatus Micrarchaeia archaeon]
MTDELEDQMIAKTEELTEGKKGPEAVAEATELSQIDPKDAIVWLVKGKAHYIDNQFDEAYACFCKAAEIERENPQIWQMMGYSLITLNRYDDAEKCLEYVKAAEPSNVEAACALGICNILQNKPQEAKRNIDLALSMGKPTAIAMLEHFHEKFFAISKETSSRAKAQIERTLETVKLLR